MTLIECVEPRWFYYDELRIIRRRIQVFVSNYRRERREEYEETRSRKWEIEWQIKDKVSELRYVTCLYDAVADRGLDVVDGGPINLDLIKRARGKNPSVDKDGFLQFLTEEIFHRDFAIKLLKAELTGLNAK